MKDGSVNRCVNGIRSVKSTENSCFPIPENTVTFPLIFPEAEEKIRSLPLSVNCSGFDFDVFISIVFKAESRVNFPSESVFEDIEGTHAKDIDTSLRGSPPVLVAAPAILTFAATAIHTLISRNDTGRYALFIYSPHRIRLTYYYILDDSITNFLLHFTANNEKMTFLNTKCNPI